jgi:nucleotide-binding universal stress UspA family protein
MKKLLVPLDFSVVTAKVMATAEELAKVTDATISLLHVVEPLETFMPVGASMDVIAAAPPPAVMDEPTAQQARLDDLVDGLRARGFRAESLAIIGLPSEDIADQAELQDVDAIVLGSHGHGGLFHLFSGSVVNGVLHRASVPVIVVPAAKEKKVKTPR